jgi:pimeloyl-ACP methyl ester carboxylesterase
VTLELSAFPTTDNLSLPALLYQPPKPTARAAIWLHGMGDNGVFYRPERINTLGEALTGQGIALLAFNNRGAHNAKRLAIADETLPEEDRGYQAGTHYELIGDCVHDIDGAVNYLQTKGFHELYLIGHSSGANKICVYNAQATKNPFQKYVLAGGGDDTGLLFTSLGSKKFWQALRYAADAVTGGHELKIMPKHSGMHPFSAQAAWGILNPDGDYNTFPFYEYTHERLGTKPLFAEFQALDRPTLVIYGEKDEYTATAGDTNGARNILMKHTSNQMLKQMDFMLVPDADHSFHGQEAEFAQRVAEWLA